MKVSEVARRWTAPPQGTRMQRDLFGAANLAATVVIPPAPSLAPHYDWPFPGLSPEDSARACLSCSREYAQVIIATILAYPDRAGTDAQVLALLPDEWKRLLGRFGHGSICERQGRPHGITVTHVTHEGPGGGFHLAYRITEAGHV